MMKPNLVWADKANLRVLDDSLQGYGIELGTVIQLKPASTGREGLEVWELGGGLHARHLQENGMGWCQLWLPFRTGRISYSVSPSLRAGLKSIGFVIVPIMSQQER